jgi:predicted SprT family Zn-dependent metalloprotease
MIFYKRVQNLVFNISSAKNNDEMPGDIFRERFRSTGVEYLQFIQRYRNRIVNNSAQESNKRLKVRILPHKSK